MNRATNKIVAPIGVNLGVAGINQVFFEMLQGSMLASGVMVNGASGLVGTLGVQLAKAGQIKSIIDKIYPIEQPAEARRCVDNEHKRVNDIIAETTQTKSFPL